MGDTIRVKADEQALWGKGSHLAAFSHGWNREVVTVRDTYECSSCSEVRFVSCPHAAAMSAPRGLFTAALNPCLFSSMLHRAIRPMVLGEYGMPFTWLKRNRDLPGLRSPGIRRTS